MDQVITFDKTYQQRLFEYVDVLSGYEALSPIQIKKKWCLHIELAIDPNGWQAVWKIPRLKCEGLKIAFPTVVLVYVEGLDFEELIATVKILAVLDDIHLPSKHYVPLIQLWPTKVQDKSIGLNLDSTANHLDMLRFFYTNLLLPWDYEEEGTVDWFSKHLETRLRLFYDIRNEVIPGITAEHIKGLLTEARRLEARREQIISQMDDNDDVDLDTDTQSAYVQNVLNIHVRMTQIRNEIEILEIPILRNALLQNQQQIQPKSCKDERHNWLVFDRGTVDDHIAFLNKVKTDVDKEKIVFVTNLMLGLENANLNDKIILSPSKHIFGTLGALQEGGIIKGLCSKEDTIITSVKDDVMLDCNGDIELINLTINVDSAQCGILVRSGTTTLKNCKIMGDGESSTHQGIIVLAGGKLNMTDCDISFFYTAIVGNSGSSLFLKNCEVSNVNVGMKIYDKCNVQAEGSLFHHCRDYGVCVETDNSLNNSAYKSGGFAALEIIPDISTENLIGENNGKGDVIINPKSKLLPVQDLFSNPELDPTILHNGSDISDEDDDINMSMEEVQELNNTVVEVNCLDEKDI